MTAPTGRTPPLRPAGSVSSRGNQSSRGGDDRRDNADRVRRCTAGDPAAAGVVDNALFRYNNNNIHYVHAMSAGDDHLVMVALT